MYDETVVAALRYCWAVQGAPCGRSHTKPGTLWQASIPIRTWAEWEDALPGFVVIDLVGYEGGNALVDYSFTLTVADIATGCTENQSFKNKAQKPEVAVRRSPRDPRLPAVPAARRRF